VVQDDTADSSLAEERPLEPDAEHEPDASDVLVADNRRLSTTVRLIVALVLLLLAILIAVALSCTALRQTPTTSASHSSSQKAAPDTLQTELWLKQKEWSDLDALLASIDTQVESDTERLAAVHPGVGSWAAGMRKKIVAERAQRDQIAAKLASLESEIEVLTVQVTREHQNSGSASKP
jgi:uncharacterized protein HemY